MSEYRDTPADRDAPSLDERLREPESDLSGPPGELGQSPRERALVIYDDETLFGAGLQHEWDRIAGPGSPQEAFQSAYEAYITDPATLYRGAPEQYQFLKEHVFYGLEYHRVTTFSEQVSEGIAALGAMEDLRPEVWEGLGVQERASALQEVEVRLAERAGRPAVPVVVEQTAPGVNGYFNVQTGVMHLDQELLSDSRALAQAVNTVAHEGRHAYQRYAVEHPGFHPDAAQVLAWSENSQNYLNAELYGYEAYRNQPVEADAWAFADALRDELYGGQQV